MSRSGEIQIPGILILAIAIVITGAIAFMGGSSSAQRQNPIFEIHPKIIGEDVWLYHTMVYSPGTELLHLQGRRDQLCEVTSHFVAPPLARGLLPSTHYEGVSATNSCPKATV